MTKRRLKEIKVLWRQPDTLSLWGLPFEMNSECGQAPHHLWEGGNRKHFIWLGQPGWWGSIPRRDQAAITRFLAPFRRAGAVPEGPNEWVSLDQFSEE